MSFDLLAPVYRGLEAVLAGGVLQRARTAHLSRIGPVRHALLLGEGHGRFLAALLAADANVRVTVVEASQGMIEAARRELRRLRVPTDRVEIVHADALTWAPPARHYDLVATHFFLDCFPPDKLATLLERIAGAAAADAVWLVSDFAVPRAGWRRWRARILHALMYGFFRVVTGLRARCVTPPDAWLAAADFTCETRVSYSFGLIESALWRRGVAPVRR